MLLLVLTPARSTVLRVATWTELLAPPSRAGRRTPGHAMRVTIGLAQRELRDVFDLRVDPADITIRAMGKLPGIRRARQHLERLPIALPTRVEGRIISFVTQQHSFVLDDRSYPPQWHVTEDDKLRRLEDLLDRLDDPESSLWWAHAMR